MRRTLSDLRTSILAITLSLVGLLGPLSCAGKESAEARQQGCKKACENVAHIELEALDRKVGSGQDNATSTVRMKPEGAQHIYGEVKKACIQTCVERGTKKKIECLQAATNKIELDACR